MNFLKNSVNYWNCGGGVRSKFDYIKDHVQINKPGLLFISESEMSSWETQMFAVSNYDLLTANTISKGKSRIVCYIHSSIKYKQVPIGSPDLDIIAVDIGGYRVVGLYRPFKLPPNCPRVSFFQSIVNTLKVLSHTDKQLLIGGDFNVDLFKPSSNLNDLHNWSITFGLQQLVQTNTWRRIVLNEIKQSAIDHIYASEELSINIIPSVSDHDMIVVFKEFETTERKKVWIRDWRGYNKDLMNNEFNTKLSQMSITSDQLNYNEFSKIVLEIVDVLAPKRVIRIKDNQIVSARLEKLKKKRDRLFKRFRKEGSKNVTLLKEIKDLNKDIKKRVRLESVRLFQSKAKSPDPKVFWQVVNQSLGKLGAQDIELEINGIRTGDSGVLVNEFANFFHNKVVSLSIAPSPITPLLRPTRPLRFSTCELEKVLKSVKGKKCHGVDGIPQIALKDVADSALIGLASLFESFASNGLPESLKEARILPLHKKGSKLDTTNYRPISNLSPFSKIYEKCLLQKLEMEIPGADGQNQHGFKHHHSTETALLTLQAYMAETLEKKLPALVYSVDLSAAFDLLIPDKFHNIFKDKISEGLMFCLMDFLQKRTFCVELGESRSQTMNLDRGCVQGSVLGPRLFSLYVGELEKHITLPDNSIKVISYADDSYVLVSAETWDELPAKAEAVLKKHIEFLRDLGMIVNEAKTELIVLGKKNSDTTPLKLSINGTTCTESPTMKSLGIVIDGSLSWDAQADLAIKKGQRLVSVYRHVRKYLTESQFLKTVTCNFYSSVYYASSVWHPNCKAVHKTKFNSLHFRLLRTAFKDYKCLIPRDEITNRCMRASPNEWSRYTTASVTMKVIRDKLPQRLHELLQSTYYSERRNVAKGLFYDSSKMKVGRQSLQNRLQHMKQIREPWNELGSRWTNDKIRIVLKDTFFKCHYQITAAKD